KFTFWIFFTARKVFPDSAAFLTFLGASRFSILESFHLFHLFHLFSAKISGLKVSFSIFFTPAEAAKQPSFAKIFIWKPSP
ncbi:hypothetical protein, partial [Flavobacterium sp. HBTb2-11-1]|uniref:hypothetical protein n=1 Tax=Flavobacterium sp. HBTb2-11-1 TaxID=2692212 RepID=UPI001F182683